MILRIIGSVVSTARIQAVLADTEGRFPAGQHEEFQPVAVLGVKPREPQAGFRAGEGAVGPE